MPELVLQCLESWHKKLPDYEFVLWDACRVSKEIDCLFVSEAISVRKWAFAADYIRLYAVYNYGGIYLDLDVEVLKSFDELLHNRMFIGQEAATYYSFNTIFKDTHATSHCFGAEANHPFIKKCLDYYQGRRFITSTHTDLPDHLRFDQTLLPVIQAQLLIPFGYKEQAYYFNMEQNLTEGIKVYPSWYFDFPLISSQKNVYCIHHCAGSWLKKRVPQARKYANLRKVLFWYIMKVINFIPRYWGFEIGVNIIRW